MKVEFVDLNRQYQSIKKTVDKVVSSILEQASFIGGAEVQSFEEAFAQYIGTQHCISCANGTDAIEILLQAMGIKKGDEVIVPSHSWISTAEAVVTVGARPVFVDTVPFRYTIDPVKIENAITPQTKAIIPVHLYGCPAEMDEICAIAKKHHLLILEDCAQSHGALYKGQKTGTLGHAASFSFYPTKNLGAYGDAGAMLTDDPALAEKIKMIKNYGQRERHHHLIHGRNSRMDTLQAAMLGVKLPYLEQWNEMRRNHAALYKSLLQGLPVGLPVCPEHCNPVYHLFVIQTQEREKLVKFLRDKGIATAIHYPQMLPVLPLYQKNHQTENYPVSLHYQDKILSLPMYPELKEEEIRYTVEKIAEFWMQSR